jgi:hypothetical protein
LIENRGGFYRRGFFICADHVTHPDLSHAALERKAGSRIFCGNEESSARKREQITRIFHQKNPGIRKRFDLLRCIIVSNSVTYVTVCSLVLARYALYLSPFSISTRIW